MNSCTHSTHIFSHNIDSLTRKIPYLLGSARLGRVNNAKSDRNTGYNGAMCCWSARAVGWFNRAKLRTHLHTNYKVVKFSYSCGLGIGER